MRAMILAAGCGKRMGSLTENTPKSLLRVGGHHLIEHTISHLEQANFREIVINISYFGEQIKAALGNGERYGVSIVYTEEKEPLETGGGIFNALSFLGNEPFLVLSSDIVTDYPLERLPRNPDKLAHLILVDNPIYHPQGDFSLNQGEIEMQGPHMLTFGNIGVYRPELFTSCQPGFFPLSAILFPAVRNAQITGEHYRGIWYNIGTAHDLAEINAAYIA